MGVCAGLAPPRAGADKPVPHHIIPQDGRKLHVTSSLSSPAKAGEPVDTGISSHTAAAAYWCPACAGSRVKCIPSRGADRVRAVPSTYPPSIGGRREGRALASPMARLQKEMQAAGTTGLAETTRPSLHEWRYGLYALSSGTGVLAPVIGIVANLASAPGCQDHTISPSCPYCSSAREQRAATPTGHRIPPRVS
jgi:hypothetical protein